MAHPDQIELAQGKVAGDAAQPPIPSSHETAGTAALADEVSRLRHALLELDDLRGENRRLLAAAREMRAENMALNRALDGSVTPEELLQVQLQAIDLNRRLALVHASLSWRITAPLRLLASLLGAGRR